MIIFLYYTYNKHIEEDITTGGSMSPLKNRLFKGLVALNVLDAVTTYIGLRLPVLKLSDGQTYSLHEQNSIVRPMIEEDMWEQLLRIKIVLLYNTYTGLKTENKEALQELYISNILFGITVVNNIYRIGKYFYYKKNKALN